MSRSRSPSPDRDAKERGSRDRRMSGVSTHSRPDLEEEAPAKRARTDVKKEDKARSKRLFGNILGTLQKFKKEDKSQRGSEAAKRREEVAERIQNKIRSEATMHHEIAESERELRTLRVQTDSAEHVLRHKTLAMKSRHEALRPISRFLHTSPSVPVPRLFEGKLLNPSPIPLSQGPGREPPHGEVLRPLYFLPKELLPEQESELASQVANIEELITEEAAQLAKEKETTTETVRKNRTRISELSEKLQDLRRQVKSSAAKPAVDEMGRWPRESIARDERESSAGGRGTPRDRERSRSRDRAGGHMDVEGDQAGNDADREAGVTIEGENGDIEVEY